MQLDKNYELVWADEFSNGERPDASKWSFSYGHGENGWGNAEKQYYDDTPGQCVIRDNVLVIRGTIDRDTFSYKSAKIHTLGKAGWQYGRFEIRAKLPQGRGTWPAIWMMPDDSESDESWPGCGEIDIMEHIGRRPGEVHFSLHSGDYNHNKKNQVTGVYSDPEYLDGFHVYTMDWDASGFTYYIDGVKKDEFLKGSKKGSGEWPYDKPYHLIINLALGGYWGGDIDDSALPAEFAIDYVRVYQKHEV